MSKGNQKSTSGLPTATTETQHIKQLCEQYIKHINPPKKKTDDLSYLELLKFSIADDLLNCAQHPKKLLELLQKKCTDQHFSNKSNAEVLRMNRNSPVNWFFKGLLVSLTFPVSLPLLMIWSFKTRGTLNFLKTDGAIFFEMLTPLCTKWVEPPSPRSPSENTPSIPTNPTLKEPKPMLTRSQPSSSRAPRTLVPRQQKIQVIESPLVPQQGENADLKNMLKLTTQMSSIFDNPRTILEQNLRRFKGQAMITSSLPIQPVGAQAPNALRLKFTGELMYVDAPLEQGEIIVFKTFSPLPREGAPASLLITNGTNAESHQTQLDWVQRGQRYCMSFFEDDFNSAMRKGRTNASKEPLADLLSTVKYYELALTLAKMDSEKVMAIEAIIGAINDSRKYWPTRDSEFYRHFESGLQKKTKAVLQQLPPNYRLLSEDIIHITAMYQTIWTLLENNQSNKAWTLFNSITLSHFLQKSCLELDAMYYQLRAVFKINGENEQLEDGALSAVASLGAAFALLSQQNYSLCLMSKYDPSIGAEPGKLYLAESMDGPLNYVIRNENNTADWFGTITQEEIVKNDIWMGYSPGNSRDFIDKLDEQLPKIIAVLVEKGHAHQRCTEEATFLRQMAIKPLGQMQLLAAEAWSRTPFNDGLARAYDLDNSKNDNIWRGCYPSIRTDRAPRYFSEYDILMFQSMGKTDPSFCHPDATATFDAGNTNTSFNPTSR